MNRIVAFFTSNKRVFLACFFALLLYAAYQFYPQINQIIGFGMMWTIGRLFPAGSMWLIVAAPWLVAGLFGAAIAIIYWLARVKNPILAATAGFSLSYVFVSYLFAFIGLPIVSEILLGSVSAYVVFFVVALAASRIPFLRWQVSVIIGVAVMGASLYVTPLLVQPVETQQMETKETAVFDTAVKSLGFTPYYPIYKSSLFPATPPVLNGYGGRPYSNKTVDFSLGKTWVRQGAVLADQDKIMNFVNNCDIHTIWSTMYIHTSVPQRDIDSSLDNFKKCNVVHETPSGNKVYLQSIGKSAYFYSKIGATNIIIVFDESSKNGYDPSKLPELTKIIDSLEPLDTSRIQKGNETIYSFGSD